VRDKYIDQKKKTQFKNKTRKSGGQNAIFTAVAGTHNFPFEKKENPQERGSELCMSLGVLKMLTKSSNSFKYGDL